MGENDVWGKMEDENQIRKENFFEYEKRILNINRCDFLTDKSLYILGEALKRASDLESLTVSFTW